MALATKFQLKQAILIFFLDQICPKEDTLILNLKKQTLPLNHRVLYQIFSKRVKKYPNV